MWKETILMLFKASSRNLSCGEQDKQKIFGQKGLSLGRVQNESSPEKNVGLRSTKTATFCSYRQLIIFFHISPRSRVRKSSPTCPLCVQARERIQLCFITPYGRRPLHLLQRLRNSVRFIKGRNNEPKSPVPNVTQTKNSTSVTDHKFRLY